jgi:uncharacterized SAM-binding protein YcdF (DUF218 family)
MRKPLSWILALAAVAGLSAHLTDIGRQIYLQSTRDEARAADVILVLGAAEYRGRPSPVFKARLDHALGLYRRGLAPRMLTTGGAGGDPQYTEGGVGRSYLVSLGVPSEAIIVEPEAATTMQSTAAAAEIMHRMGLKSAVLVSDGYHIFRAKSMLSERGIRVYGSPRPGPEADPSRHWWLYVRQSVGYLLWEIGIRY